MLPFKIRWAVLEFRFISIAYMMQCWYDQLFLVMLRSVIKYSFPFWKSVCILFDCDGNDVLCCIHCLMCQQQFEFPTISNNSTNFRYIPTSVEIHQTLFYFCAAIHPVLYRWCWKVKDCQMNVMNRLKLNLQLNFKCMYVYVLPQNKRFTSNNSHKSGNLPDSCQLLQIYMLCLLTSKCIEKVLHLKLIQKWLYPFLLSVLLYRIHSSFRRNAHFRPIDRCVELISPSKLDVLSVSLILSVYSEHSFTVQFKYQIFLSPTIWFSATHWPNYAFRIHMYLAHFDVFTILQTFICPSYTETEKVGVFVHNTTQLRQISIRFFSLRSIFILDRWSMVFVIWFTYWYRLDCIWSNQKC